MFKYFVTVFCVFSFLAYYYYFPPSPVEETSLFVKSKRLDQVCQKILEITSSPYESKIIINGMKGGLGHKSISTVEEIIYALILKKQLWFITLPLIYNLTDSCLKSREYRQNVSDIRVCPKDSCLNEFNDTIDLRSSFREDSVLFDVRLPRSVIQTPENLQILRESKLLYDWQGWDDLYKFLYKIVLNPVESVKKEIEEEKRRLTRPYTFGVQVRTGGNLANDYERTSMISEEAMHKIPSQIEDICKKHNVTYKDWNLYISSDSDRATNYLFDTFKSKFNVIFSTKYTRGHTSSRHLKSNSLMSAMIDVHILGSSDILLTTKRSGFGRIASAMVYPHPSYFIPVNRTFVEKLS